MKEQLRIGIAGFGRFAQAYYSPALKSMQKTSKFFIADPSELSRRAAAEKFPDACIFNSWETMLEKGDLSALLVASPPSTHIDVWKAALLKSLPVFMEKPFPLSNQLNNLDCSTAQNDKMMVNFSRRFWPLYQRAADLIRKKELGKEVSSHITLQVNLSKWCGVSNHRMQPSEGGVLHDLGSQALDLSLLLHGEYPDSLSAFKISEKSWKLELQFRSGSSSEIIVSYGRRNRESLSVKGEDGFLHIKDPNCCLHINNRPGPFADFAALGFRALLRNQSMLRFTVARSLQTFFRSIKNSGPFFPGFKESITVSRLILAAQKSAVSNAGRNSGSNSVIYI